MSLGGAPQGDASSCAHIYVLESKTHGFGVVSGADLRRREKRVVSAFSESTRLENETAFFNVCDYFMLGLEPEDQVGKANSLPLNRGKDQLETLH